MLYKCIFLLGLILTLLLNPISGEKNTSSSHSYHKSDGLSADENTSSGLSSVESASSNSHGYASSRTSDSDHSYQSIGTATVLYTSPEGSWDTSRSTDPLIGVNQALSSIDSYPSSTVSPTNSVHSYPSHAGKLYYTSGKYSYPPSQVSNSPSSDLYTSLGGNSNSGGAFSGGDHGHSTKPIHHSTYVYNNYHYKPPAKIIYIPSHGSPPINYPVYHGPLPDYVYQYKDSGSKYSTLLAGLALMNLGALDAAGYAVHQANNKNDINNYKPNPNELCIFGIKKVNGDYEEIKIDCQIISTFILQEKQRNLVNSTIFTYINSNGTQGQGVTSPVNSANVALVDVINANEYSLPSMTAPQTPRVSQDEILCNSTLVPKEIVSVSFGGITNAGQLKSASDFKGVPVEVTSKTECFVMSHSPTWNMKTPIPCRLLQVYADTSLHSNSGVHNIPPIFTVLVAILVYGIVY